MDVSVPGFAMGNRDKEGTGEMTIMPAFVRHKKNRRTTGSGGCNLNFNVLPLRA